MPPHYIRFARAIALVSGVSAAGCYQAHERRGPERDAGPADAVLVDVGPCSSPLPCLCATLAMPGTCGGTSFERCCPIVGPLDPPDLPRLG